MSSTPTNSSTEPKAPGWTHGLFGSTWFSSKKKSRVDSSTTSTASKSHENGTDKRVLPSPEPFQNLEGFDNVKSPEQLNFATPRTEAETKRPSRANTTPMQQQSQSLFGRRTQTTSALPSAMSSAMSSAMPSAMPSGRTSAASAQAPAKSPWKGSSAPSANGVQFSVGDLRASSSSNTTRSTRRSMSTSSRVAPVARPQRRKKYVPSRLLTINRRSNNGSRNRGDINRLLLNARASIVASNQKIEADNNFRTSIIRIKPGRRLLPGGQQGVTGRLAQQPPSGTSDVLLTNGKRLMARYDDDGDDDGDGDSGPEVVSKKKKRRVNFGDEEKTSATPIENFVSTPAKDINKARKSKRKATPFKKASAITDGDDAIDEDEDENKTKPPISAPSPKRELLKAKRPTPAQPATELQEEFPICPEKNLILGDYSAEWSTTEERESFHSSAMAGTRIVSKWYSSDLYTPGKEFKAVEHTMPLPQFNQKPLFVGKKKDRTVVENDDENEEEMQIAKRAKPDKWECPECGFKNSDDESHCQNMVPDGTSKNLKKCLACRSKEIKSEGWGNLFKSFAHLDPDKIKCAACGVPNSKERATCEACEAQLDGGSTSKKDNAKPSASSATRNAPGLIGSNGFSFGGAGATSSAPSMSTSKFSFGAPQSSKSKSSGASEGGAKAGGFTFGVPPAPSETSASTKTSSFMFGAGAAPAPSTSSTTSTTKMGGFQFGSLPSPAPSKSTASPATTSGGFQFNIESSKAPSTSSSTPSTQTGGFKLSSGPAPAPSGTSSTSFQFGSTPAPAPASVSMTAPTPSPAAPAKTAFTFGSSGATTSANSSSKSDSGPTSTGVQFSFGSSKSTISASETESSKMTAKENDQKRKKGDDSSTSTAAPTSFFGSGSPAPSTTFSVSNTDFTAGSMSTPSSGFPTKSSATDAPLGSVTTKENDDANSKKKRRSHDDSSAPSSSKSTFTFGNAPSTQTPATSFTFGNPAQAPAPVPPASAPADPIFNFGNSTTDSSSQGTSSNTASGFGLKPAAPVSNAAPTFGTTPAPAFGATPAPATAVSFGSTPAPATGFGATPAPAPTFGATPAPAPSFGATPAPAPTFGATPAPAPTFGATPAPAPSFGATPATAPSFGATPAPAPTFGATPAPAPSFGFGSTSGPSNSMNFGSATPAPTFGSTPAAAPAPFGTPAPMTFGSSAPPAAPFGPTPAASTQPFGSSATTFGSAQPQAGAPVPMSFGGTPAPAPGGFGGGFGQQTPQPPPGGGFSMGTGGGSSRGTGRRGTRRIIRAKRPK